MKNLHFNVFLIHKINNGIIFESFYTNKPFDKTFLKLCITFKKIICRNDMLELKDFIITYKTHSIGLMGLILHFFKLKFKKILFPFYFKVRVDSENNVLKERILAFFIEFVLNLCLMFK